MALIDCPETECESQVSTTANSCMSCGADIQKYLNTFADLRCPYCEYVSRYQNPFPDLKLKKVEARKGFFRSMFSGANVTSGGACQKCEKSVVVNWFHESKNN